MKCKGGWRVGHALRESREGSREIAMQLRMLGKERRTKFSSLKHMTFQQSMFTNYGPCQGILIEALFHVSVVVMKHRGIIDTVRSKGV